MTAPHTTLRRPAAWFWQIEPVAAQSRGDLDFFIGLAIVALAPAVFWPLAIKGLSLLMGFSVSWFSLGVLGGVIFVFLGSIYGLIARRR